MPFIVTEPLVPLVAEAQRTLGLTQAQLGELLGISRRTVIRWSGASSPSQGDLVKLAKAVFPKDPALADRLARAGGARLHELGLAPPPQAPPSPQARENAIASIVCAAAEASVGTPQAARAGLLAALDRAATLGVTSEELRSALRPSGPRGK
jgi:transcriptional regulator with XRE-family HTH domain